MGRNKKYWKFQSGSVSLEKPVLVGILNVTPDSFSDGGEYVAVEHAIERARLMIKQGAEIIDIGGESTRPGAKRISAAEQMQRVLPVIQEMHDVFISIDTTSVEVAAAAIDAGASIINDVSACQDEPEMFGLAATTGAGLVLMHRLVEPELDQYSDKYHTSPEYGDVVGDVRGWLLARVEIALGHGVKPEAIAIDPGLGFGKSVGQNVAIIEGIEDFVESGYPVFVGASRKSFIGAISEISDPKERDEASARVAVTLFRGGAKVFRVHDVRTHKRMLQSASQEMENNRR